MKTAKFALLLAFSLQPLAFSFISAAHSTAAVPAFTADEHHQ